MDVGDQKAVRVFHKRDSSGKQRNTRWPAELGNYCWFVLYKENKDTMDAINLLSKLLKIKAGMFGYAGTKDRRAVTTQQVSIYRVRAEQLQDLNASLWNMCVGNFKYCREPLKLGSLSGNHFIITLRNVVGDHDKIAESLESLKVNGFINYFGLQRFGTTSVPTHKIGVFQSIYQCLYHQLISKYVHVWWFVSLCFQKIAHVKNMMYMYMHIYTVMCKMHMCKIRVGF